METPYETEVKFYAPDLAAIQKRLEEAGAVCTAPRIFERNVRYENETHSLSDKGIVRCLNPTTGEDVWFDRLPGDYSASPLESEGHIYFCSQNGTCTVLQAGDEFKVLAKNTLDADFMASPAVAGKALFLRSTTHLYRIENR